MSNFYSSARAASNQKDMLIHQLKQEIFELQSKSKDYNGLRSNYIQLEASYRKMVDDKSCKEDDFRYQFDASYSESQTLRHSVEDLRNYINELSKKLSEVQQEFDRQRAINQKRYSELENVAEEIKLRGENGVVLKRELEDLCYEVDSVKD